MATLLQFGLDPGLVYVKEIRLLELHRYQTYASSHVLNSVRRGWEEDLKKRVVLDLESSYKNLSSPTEY